MGKMASRISYNFRFMPYIDRILGFGNRMIWVHCRSWVFKSFGRFVGISSFLFIVQALSWGYSYFFPGVELVTRNYEALNATNPIGACNFYDGNWVYDESYSSYNASECPFAERGFNCLANGRRDKWYLKWRWKPKNCDVPRFDAHVILKKLRGKRVVFVGDSLSRTQWESMICLLMTGVEDKQSVYEVNGNVITKQLRHLGVRFGSYNFTVEFYRSVFLVQPGSVPKRAPKRAKSTIKLDKLDDISSEWINSDVLVFNTGHWWTPTKLFEIMSLIRFLDRGCYFQVGGRMKLGMSVNTAYMTALATWGSWVESMVNTNRTHVIFRTFEPSHWIEGRRQICKVTEQPMTNSSGKDQSPFSEIVMKVVKNMSVPITVMHVTPMGSFRSDAHVGTWSDNPLVPDCSHWCLPGVPDAWNEILFSYLTWPNQASHMLHENLDTTVIVVVFVSFGCIFFFAFVLVALCCFIKRRKKTTVQETDIVRADEHMKVKEAVVPGPHGAQAVVLTIEDDMHIEEEIRKNETLGKGMHVKSTDNIVGALEAGEPSSTSGSHHDEHHP